MIGFKELLVGFFLALALYVYIVVVLYGRILSKAGFSRWLALLMLIPGANVVLVWVFAFIDWPALEQPK